MMAQQYHIDYQKAILLNNTAVYQIEIGNYEKACILLQHALKALHNSSINMKDSQNDISQYESSCGESSGCNNKRSRIEVKWSRDAPLHLELKLPAPSPDISYIFRRALFFVNKSNTSNNVVEERDFLPQNNMDQESKGIIYNLALSYLLSGFVNNNAVKLKRARELFEKIVYSIIYSTSSAKSKASSGKDHPHPSCDEFELESMDKSDNDYLLEAAIYNNMGWLDEEFCDFHLAQVCYNEVFYRMEYLLQNGSLKRQECEGFIENIERVDLNDHLIAAAA